jgi:hypothetical protein
VSPVRCGLGFYIPEDGILHSHRRYNLKRYIVWWNSPQTPGRLHLPPPFSRQISPRRLTDSYVRLLRPWKLMRIKFPRFRWRNAVGKFVLGLWQHEASDMRTKNRISSLLARLLFLSHGLPRKILASLQNTCSRFFARVLQPCICAPAWRDKSLGPSPIYETYGLIGKVRKTNDSNHEESLRVVGGDKMGTLSQMRQ